MKGPKIKKRESMVFDHTSLTPAPPLDGQRPYFRAFQFWDLSLNVIKDTKKYLRDNFCFSDYFLKSEIFLCIDCYFLINAILSL